MNEIKLADLSDEELLELRASVANLESRYNISQNSFKLILNAGYGAIGNEHFRHFDFRVASSITGNGQAVIKYISNKMNLYLDKMLGTSGVDYTVYIDTDSIYLNMEGIVNKFILAKKPDASDAEITELLNKVCIRVNKEIDKEFRRLKERTNMREHRMFMDREGIFKTGFWTKKKRYALSCHDMEGVRYTEPRFKIMGLETQRSTTPTVCRSKLKEAIQLILTNDNDSVIEYIKNFREEFDSFPLEDIVFYSGCNNIGKYSDHNDYPIKGTPGHVRAAITHNRMIGQDPNLSTKYMKITEGSTVKIVLLQEANPIRENRFAFMDKFPEETGLLKYIDKDAMFEAGFLSPLKTMLEAIQWDHEKIITLDAFF